MGENLVFNPFQLKLVRTYVHTLVSLEVAASPDPTPGNVQVDSIPRSFSQLILEAQAPKLAFCRLSLQDTSQQETAGRMDERRACCSFFSAFHCPPVSCL